MIKTNWETREALKDAFIAELSQASGEVRKLEGSEMVQELIRNSFDAFDRYHAALSTALSIAERALDEEKKKKAAQ